MKRTREYENSAENEDNQPKGQREDDTEPVDINKPTKITDINTYCLEGIFNYLTLSDLLNVSDACKHFKDAADFVFSAKYRKKAVIINEIRVFRTRLLDIKTSYIKIDDIKTSLQLLRCFGHLILKLKIYVVFSTCDERAIKFGANSVKLLVKYVGFYCFTSLTSLTIKKGPVQVLNLLKRPFLKMEKVEINTWDSPRSKLDKIWFSKLFPNIKCLKYESVFGRVTDYECIENEFKSLEHLDISYGFVKCKNLFNCSKRNITNEECIAHNTNVKVALQLNPQLRTLSLPFISDFNILQDICEHQQQLECLSFQYAPRDSSSCNGKLLHFKTIKKLKVCFCGPNRRSDTELMAIPTTGNEMQKIPLSFDILEELTFETCYQYSDEFFDFIRKHQSIVKINLRSCRWPRFYLDDINRIKLHQALPLLKEIHIMCYTLQIDEAIAFTTSFKALEQFSFKLFLWDKFSELVKRLSPEWNSSLNSHGFLVTLKRKF